jgi:hypothetical protein
MREAYTFVFVRQQPIVHPMHPYLTRFEEPRSEPLPRARGGDRKGTHLDSSLERLDLHARALKKPILLHVDNLARVAIHAPGVFTVRVLGL